MAGIYSGSKADVEFNPGILLNGRYVDRVNGCDWMPHVNLQQRLLILHFRTPPNYGPPLEERLVFGIHINAVIYAAHKRDRIFRIRFQLNQAGTIHEILMHMETAAGYNFLEEILAREAGNGLIHYPNEMKDWRFY